MKKTKLDMKILYVSNNEEYPYERMPRGDLAYLHFFQEKGNEVLALPKKDMLKFYSAYKKFKPDIVASTWVPAGFIPAFLNKLGLIKCPVIHYWDDFYADAMITYPRFLINFLERFTIKNSDYITTISRYNESRAKQFSKPVFYIPNGITSNVKKTKLNLDSLKTSPKNLKVVYSGNQFHKLRRLDTIILAVKDLDCDLFLIGKTDPKLVPIAPSNVHFMGEVDPHEVLSILKQADILVNNMDADCNFKLFDYISVGKPIVTSDGMVRYLLKDKEDAILTNDFRKDLKMLIEDKNLREKLERNIKKIKVKTWEQVAEEHLKVYSSILLKGK